jgi:hypothetical protein
MHTCFYCGNAATGYCSGCGHYVCNSPICNGLATLDTAKRAGQAVGRAGQAVGRAAARQVARFDPKKFFRM